MPDTVYDRIADTFIDASKIATSLYPKPKTSFADYFKEKAPTPDERGGFWQRYGGQMPGAPQPPSALPYGKAGRPVYPPPKPPKDEGVDIGEGLTLKFDGSVWHKDISWASIGKLDKQTGQFKPAWWVGPLQIISTAFKETGKTMALPGFLEAERQEREAALAGRLSKEETERVLTQRPLSSLKPEELEKKYKDLPHALQLATEIVPLFAAGALGLTATGLRGALTPATQAAKAAVRIPAQVAKVALAPVAVAEVAPAYVLKYGIAWPLKQVAVKGIAPALQKSFEIALDKGLDKWLVRQGIRGDQANRIVRIFLEKNNRWLFEQGKTNLLKRRVTRMDVNQKAGSAAEETIRQAEPRLLAAVKGEVPAKPLITPAKPVEVPPQPSRAVTQPVKPEIRPRLPKAIIPPPITPPPPPPITPPIVPPAGDPIKQLTLLVRSAKPIRKETEVLKSAELKKRVAAAAGVLEKGEAREAFLRSKGMLKGELPQAAFEPPEVGLTPDAINGLFGMIRDSDTLYFQRLNTSTALEKLLLGQIPTRSEIALLEEAFGTDLAKAILSKRPMGEKAWETFLDVWNIPRAVLASWDLSAPLRQGAVLAPAHFKEWIGGFKPMLQAFAKEKHAIAIDRVIQTGKHAELRAESGLFHAPIKGVGAKLTQREEVFVSNLARYIPLIRRSERAYITFLNKLRADVFDNIVENWEKAGVRATKKDYTELAKFVNRASGRGGLGKLEDSAPFLSGMLFSPRLQMARITIGNSLLTGTAPVRKEAAKNLSSFVGTGLAILALVSLAGAEVGKNPLSADFGKIRIGKTRLDIWGGFQQYARFISTLIMGMKKSTISGQTYEANRMDIIQQFLRSKLMPTLSFFYDLMVGRTYIGEKMEMDIQQAYQRLAPMFIQDMVDAINSEGIPGGFVAIPGVLGIGIVSYDLPNWPELEKYFNLETTKERNSYRMSHAENEAKLFILGRFTVLQNPMAKGHVIRIMREHKIKPEDVRGYDKVFGPQPIPQPTPQTRPKVPIWQPTTQPKVPIWQK